MYRGRTAQEMAAIGTADASGRADHRTARLGNGLEVRATEIPEVKLIRPARYGDHRGFFSESYNRRALAEAGIEVEFVQDNHVYSKEAGTLRGLHFQAPLNRTEFPGGGFVWLLMPPRQSPPGSRSSALQPRPAECCRWARAGGGG